MVRVRISIMLTSYFSIIFVHGLQGHPYKTWAKAKTSQERHRATPTRSESSTLSERKKEKRSIRHLLSKFTKKSDQRKDQSISTKSCSDQVREDDITRDPDGSVFWPADLLPAICPQARVLVYGYDTKVTNYMASSTNKNGIFSHSKDLLFALSREVSSGRPLIFIAHSLGGIVVKEVRQFRFALIQHATGAASY